MGIGERIKKMNLFIIKFSLIISIINIVLMMFLLFVAARILDPVEVNILSHENVKGYDFSDLNDYYMEEYPNEILLCVYGYQEDENWVITKIVRSNMEYQDKTTVLGNCGLDAIGTIHKL